MKNKRSDNTKEKGKLKKFFRGIWNAIRKAYEKMMNVGSRSLIFNTIRAMVAVCIILVFFYMLMPNNIMIESAMNDFGDVSVDSGVIEYSEITVSDHAMFAEYEELTINTNNKEFQVGDKQYDSDCTLLVRNNAGRDYICNVYGSDSGKELECLGINADEVVRDNYLAQLNKVNEFEDKSIKLPDVNYQRMKKIGNYIVIEGLNKYNIFSYFEDMEILTDAEVIVKRGDEEIDCYPAGKDNGVRVFIPNCFQVTVEARELRARFFGLKSYTVICTDIAKLGVAGSGTVQYAYSIDNYEFEMKGQQIDLTSASKRDLSAVMEKNSSANTMNFSGKVKNAEIDGTSLQPTLMKWLTEQAFVLPVLVFTIMQASLALLNKQKKKEE